MTVTVERMKRMQLEGNLKALADVRVDDWLIRGFRIVQQPNQRAYVQVPQVPLEHGDGSKSWFPMIDLPEEDKTQIRQAVLEAWKEGVDDSATP